MKIVRKTGTVEGTMMAVVVVTQLRMEFRHNRGQPI